MDIGQIATIHSALKSVNLNGGSFLSQNPEVVVKEHVFNCPHCLDRGYTDCSWCDGNGYFQDYEDQFPCRQCDGTGKSQCLRCYGEDNQPKIDTMWSQDEMDIPSEETFQESKIIENRKRNFSKESDEVDSYELDESDGGDKLDSTLASGVGAMVPAIGKQQNEFFPEQEMWGVDYTEDEDHADTSDNEDSAVEPSPEDVHESVDDDLVKFVNSWTAGESRKRDIEQYRSRMEHEINWCQEAIKKLEELLSKKPSKIKEINTLKRQIREKELKLAFDPMYGGEIRELPVERQMMDKLGESTLCSFCNGNKYVPKLIKVNLPSGGFRTGSRAVPCPYCNKNGKKITKEAQSNPNFMREFIDKMDSIVNEVAPDDQESWVKKNKKRFKKEYGKEKGLSVLYSLAWKNHNKKK